MLRALRLHPDSRRGAASRIAVEMNRPAPSRLTLHYTLTGRMADIVLPPPDASQRTDELWRHTCFEAFVRTGAGYLELNFAPSTRWAAYRFDGYRQNPRPAEAAPEITVQAGEGQFDLQVTLDLPELASLAALRLGLSAVVEEAGGQLSYWALTHPPGKADFHHADGFALELA